MNMRDYLELGLKLLGVYFGVLGVVNAVNAIVQLLVVVAMNADELRYGGGLSLLWNLLYPLALPAGYLLCAFFLVRRTDRCLQLVGPLTNRTASDS